MVPIKKIDDEGGMNEDRLEEFLN